MINNLRKECLKRSSRPRIKIGLQEPQNHLKIVNMTTNHKRKIFKVLETKAQPSDQVSQMKMMPQLSYHCTWRKIRMPQM